MEIKTGISLSGRISIGCDNYGAIMIVITLYSA